MILLTSGSTSIRATGGDPERLTAFAKADAAETWFEENDLEGVTFEYEVRE